MNNTNTSEQTISYGLRGNEFKEFIKSLIARSNLNTDYISVLLSDDSLEIYNQAFTTQEANPEENEEFFEQLGDQTANHFIVSYAYRRFPQLKCPKGVKVVARLRINYGSREIMSTLADNLGFWPFITATDDQKLRQKKDRLEDAFEAFCGATEYILDNSFQIGVGNAIVYSILESVYNEIPISLDFDDLYDGKTKLKEIFDSDKTLGLLNYIDKRVEDDNNMSLTTSTVYRIVNRASDDLVLQIGHGSAARKADAQQKAARDALKNLRRQGIGKPIPSEYRRFQEIGDTVERFKNSK
jgi:dsRNA-specific ribonuclease